MIFPCGRTDYIILSAKSFDGVGQSQRPDRSRLSGEWAYTGQVNYITSQKVHFMGEDTLRLSV